MKTFRINLIFWGANITSAVLLLVGLLGGGGWWKHYFINSWQLVAFSGGISILCLVIVNLVLLSFFVLRPLKKLTSLLQALGQKELLEFPASFRVTEFQQLKEILQERTAYIEELIRIGDDVLAHGYTDKAPVREEHQRVGKVFQHFISLFHSIDQYVGMLASRQLMEALPAELQNTRIGESLRRMTGELSASIREIGREAKSISTTSAEVAALAQQSSRNATRETEAIESISSSSRQVAANLRNVMENIHLQGESLDNTFHDIEHLVGSIETLHRNVEVLSSVAEATSLSVSEIHKFMREIDKHAHSLASISETVSNEAGEGGEAVNEVTEGIQTIKHTVEDAAVTIHRLGEKSEQIGEILEAINGIADQTNLLALNASIIAAQAGEHGRGFAVVAGEIRDLAERTRASTKEIETIILGLQSEVAHGGVAMKECLRAVEDGVGLANKSGATLKKIVQSIQGASQMAADLAESTVTQTNNSEQVNLATEQITQKLEELSTTVNNQAQDSSHLSEMANILKNASQDITQLATAQLRETETIVHSIQSIQDLVQRNAKIAHQLAASSEELGGLESVLAKEMGQFLVSLPELPSDFDPKRPTIAFVCPNAPFFFKAIYQGLQEKAREKGFQAIMLQAKDSRMLQTQMVNWLGMQPWFTGMVLVPMDEYIGGHIISLCKRKEIPVVIADRQCSQATLSILSDNMQGGELAAELLREKLPDDVTVVACGSPDIHSIFNRMEGFFQKSRVYNWNVVEVFTSTISKEQAKPNIFEGLTLTPDVRGVFLTNEDASMAYLELLQEEKDSLADLQVVTYDLPKKVAEAIEAGDLLGTIYQDPAEIGREAVSRLCSFSENGAAFFQASPEELHLPVKVVTGSNLEQFR